MATEKMNETQAAPAAGGSLLDDILAETRMKPSDEGYDVARRGVQAFVQELLAGKGAVSPGITISAPPSSLLAPVTSVVRK